ncbi:MAG TPA: bacteriohemerythrin [Rhodocyclaceae bacterium]
MAASSDVFSWDDRFLTGEPVVDAEHRELVRIINHVAALHAAPGPRRPLDEVLASLVRYAQTHFAHEEQLMREAGCDERHVRVHRGIHREFAEQIGDMQGSASDAADRELLLHFLTHWLAHHILSVDQSMARQVRAIRAGRTPQDAFEMEQRLSVDPSLAIILDALRSLYRVIASRNKALAHLDRELAEIIDGDPVPTLVIDAAHRITHWNKACAKITGLSARDMVGTRSSWRAFYPEERPILADLILSGSIEDIRALYGDKMRRSAVIEGAVEAEDFFPHFGDSGRWLFFTAAPIRDAEGRLIGVIETLQDVTERRRAEEKLRQHQVRLEELVAERTRQLEATNQALARRNVELTRLNKRLSEAQAQLLQSEKLASIGQLAAGVAHEINNPIGFVQSNIGTLDKYLRGLLKVLEAYEEAEPLIADGARRESLQELRRRVDLEFLKSDASELLSESRDGIGRVTKIVQDLKDFSRVGSGEAWECADLHRGIDSTLNIVANELKYKADVVREYGALPPVECVPSQLNQVFMNLLVNAAHAIGKERGVVTIRTGAQAGHVWLEFSDTGCGIPEDIRARIFDPFFTTKPVGQGTGLGLSLAYGIIRHHEGSITVESEVGKGTTFRIRLPVQRGVQRVS